MHCVVAFISKEILILMCVHQLRLCLTPRTTSRKKEMTFYGGQVDLDRARDSLHVRRCYTTLLAI